jgi:hypothetical protein
LIERKSALARVPPRNSSRQENIFKERYPLEGVLLSLYDRDQEKSNYTALYKEKQQ